MKIIGPKRVKRASSWCVTTQSGGQKGILQKQEWFSTEEKALEFIKNESRKSNATN